MCSLLDLSRTIVSAVIVMVFFLWSNIAEMFVRSCLSRTAIVGNDMLVLGVHWNDNGTFGT